MRLPGMTATGAAARRAIESVPRELARQGAPLIGRVAGLGAPDPQLAVRRYRALAAAYDRRTAAGHPYRRRSVLALAPEPGEVIVDVGCGTGLNFELVEACIGRRGRIVGVDASAEMIERARKRVREHGWRNVTLVNAGAADVELDELADGALLCGVHDVMRSPGALANVLRLLRPGGRIVAGGPKWVPWWRPGSVALNLSTRSANREYVTTFEGFDRPWSALERLVGELHVEEVLFGGGYIATGARARV
jgi:demethylmenaquinone methyltransferase/2-methoxy-6-polyprenyl-1,4-benzoquinol methylase